MSHWVALSFNTRFAHDLRVCNICNDSPNVCFYSYMGRYPVLVISEVVPLKMFLFQACPCFVGLDLCNLNALRKPKLQRRPKRVEYIKVIK